LMVFENLKNYGDEIPDQLVLGGPGGAPELKVRSNFFYPLVLELEGVAEDELFDANTAEIVERVAGIFSSERFKMRKKTTWKHIALANAVLDVVIIELRKELRNEKTGDC